MALEHLEIIKAQAIHVRAFFSAAIRAATVARGHYRRGVMSFDFLLSM